MNTPSAASAFRWALWFGLLALSGKPLLTASDKPTEPLDDALITLPKFYVIDSRILPPPESWRYATFPGFEVLSNASDSSTQHLVQEFRLFQTAVSTIWPVAQARSAARTSLILCARRNAFAAFIPASDERSDSGKASFFISNQEQSAIVVDLQTSIVNIAYATRSDSFSVSALGGDTDFGGAGLDIAAASEYSSNFRVDHSRQLQREYIHYLLGRSGSEPPAWLEEGLVQMFMAMKFDGTSIIFGEIEDPNTVSSSVGMGMEMAAIAAAAGNKKPYNFLGPLPQENRDFTGALSGRALMGLQEMFDVKPDSDVARNPLGSRWPKQCQAFVHYCLYSNNAKRLQKPFFAFVDRTSREPATEAIFKECFGMSYKDMLMELRSYIQFAGYRYQEFTAAKKGEHMPKPEPLELRDATQSEVGRIKGEALILAEHPDAARLSLITPYIRGERDPQLLASLGLYEHTVGHDDRARKLLEAAAQAKVARPRAYLELARLRFVEALDKPAGTNGRLAPTQLASILRPLFIARKQPPPLPEVYGMIANAWAQSEVPPTDDEIGFGVLGEGVRLFPRNSELIYQIATVFAQYGRNQTASDLVGLGLQFCQNDATKERFTQLQAKLPPESAAAPGKIGH